MRILELFSGTASFSTVAKDLGNQTLTIDNNPIFNPDICADITNICIGELQLLKRFNPDIIWASPPCETFSVASISTHWTGGKNAYIPKTDNAKKGINCVLETIEIINELKPTYWFIENPRGVLRKMPFMQNSNRYTVTYCQYGDKRMKPTDIWTNLNSWKPKKMCKNGDSCHERSPRGAKTGTQGLKNRIDRARIPRELCMEILKNILECEVKK